MEYSTEDLPASCLVPSKGNFATRNAQFRRAVCEHLRLRVVIVNGSGNCFFESVIMLLREAGLCPDTMSALQLRRDLVQFFRACIGSPEHYCERVLIEIENELNEELIDAMTVPSGFVTCDTDVPVDACSHGRYTPVLLPKKESHWSSRFVVF